MDFDSIEKLSNEEIEELYQLNIGENIYKSTCMAGYCANGTTYAGRYCWKYCNGSTFACSGELNAPNLATGCNLTSFVNSANFDCKAFGKATQFGVQNLAEGKHCN